jgi:DNA polymerase-3 subunit delta'
MSDLFFDMVFGHEQATLMLSKAVISQTVPQSLLITGLPQLGKATLARTLAMALNCRLDPPPCGHCPNCRKVAGGHHPDVIIFDTPHETLSIEQIRTLQRDLALRPHEGRYKVAVLANFERATTSAANALLKTLEEPPAHVILILTSLDATLLLPTIVSRCQIIPLRPISEPLIAEILQTRWQASANQAELLSRLAQGRLGWAIQVLKEPELLTQRNQYLEDLVQLSQSGYADRLDYAARLAGKEAPVGEVLSLWLAWWRDVLLVSQSRDEAVINIDRLEHLTWFARQLSARQVIAVIQQNMAALKNLNYNVNLRLNIEVLLLNLPFIASIRV